MKVKDLGTNDDCNHCWHAHRGPIYMVIKDGHTVQSCCKCQALRQVHVDHVRDRDHQRQRLRRFADRSSYFAPMGQYVKW